MYGVPLNVPMRNSIISLKETSRLMDDVTHRLASGMKISNALDNPDVYFSSQSLSNRATELNSLMDSIGQAIQILKTAEVGIQGIMRLAEQADATAQFAFDIGNSSNTASITGDYVLENDTVLSGIDGINEGDIIYIRLGVAYEMNGTTNIKKTIETTGVDDGLYFDLFHGTDYHRITSDGIGDDASKLLDKFTELGLNAEFGEDGHLNISSKQDNSLTIVEGGPPTAEDFNRLIGLPISETFTIAANSKASDLVGTIDSIDGINSQLKDGLVYISTREEQEIVVTDAANSSAAKILGISTEDADFSGFALIRRTRSTKAQEYNDIRGQIDKMAKDTSYKGVNLLNGDYLRVNFSEARSSGLDVFGVTFDSLGLGITEAENRWESKADINKAIDQINQAMESLKVKSQDFGGKLNVVLERERYANALIDLLEAGANKLVMADIEEETAHSLALQTRYMLGITALGLSSRSSTNVLNIFDKGSSGSSGSGAASIMSSASAGVEKTQTTVANNTNSVDNK